MSGCRWETSQSAGPVWSFQQVARWNWITRKKKRITERWESFVPLLPAVWSALILCTVFTFFASFCSSSWWKWFILMACQVDTVGIQLRHPEGVRARVLRESPSGSVWHVDPHFLPGLMGMCSLVRAAAAFCLSVCPSVPLFPFAAT